MILVPQFLIWVFMSDYNCIQYETASRAFYKGIITVPRKLKGGPFLGVFSRQFAIFNANKDEDVVVTSIVINNENVTVAEALPVTIAPLEHKDFTISGIFDGELNINISGTNFSPVTYGVTGYKVDVIPYMAEAPMDETYSWGTTVLKSQNGNEQRIRVRKYPRRKIRQQVPIPMHETGKAMNLCSSLLKKKVLCPLWNFGLYAQYEVFSGSNYVDHSVPVSALSIKVGDFVMVWNSFDDYEVQQVKSVSGARINFEANFTRSFLKPYVIPLKEAFLSDGVVRSPTGLTDSLEVTYELINGREGYSATPPSTIIIPNHASEENLSTKVELVDYGSGVVDFTFPFEKPDNSKSFSFIAENLGEALDLQDFIFQCAGKYNQFLAPTHENDIEFEYQSDSNKIVVKDNEHIKNGLRYIFKNGSSFQEIESAEIISGGLLELTLTAPVTEYEVGLDYICYGKTYRLDNDNITFQWVTGGKVFCKFTAREIVV